MRIGKYTAVIHEEGDGYVSLCPELDVASQGDTVEGALKNLKEAVELFLEIASEEEIERRELHHVFVTQFEAEDRSLVHA
jgi:predicted RNase H-like HicB family nuclease